MAQLNQGDMLMSTTSFSPEALVEEADFKIKNPAILCVDDEQFILDSLYNILEKHFGDKYQYEFAESAEEALSVVKELDKEGATLVMVITDRVMPGMSGDELLEKLHTSHPKTIKILLTGQASTESAINAINNVDLFKYLTKPWDANGFLNTIENGLTHYFSAHTTQEKMHIFNKLVPNELLNTINNESLPDLAFDEITAREMTLLYTDAKCLTSFIKELSRDDANKIVKAYMETIKNLIKDHNGYIDERIGSPITAIFQNSTQALQASTSIKTAIMEFQKKNKATMLPIKIGLYTGHLMLEDAAIQADTGITHQTIQLSQAIHNLCESYRANNLIGETTLSKLNLAKFDTRWVATISAESLDRNLKLFELLNLNLVEDQYKIDTKIAFERALGFYFEGAFAGAKYAFEKILSQHADKTSEYYLELCNNNLSTTPVNQWSGVKIVNI